MAEYIREKIQVLKELCIKVSKEDIKHMKSLKSEVQIDNFARDIILK